MGCWSRRGRVPSDRQISRGMLRSCCRALVRDRLERVVGTVHQSEASVRSRMSKTIGVASATHWASLRRWMWCVLALFDMRPNEVGTLREHAAHIVTFTASHVPIS